MKASKIRTRVIAAEKLLATPQLQARTPAAAKARTCLICQLHYGAQVMAAIREHEDYRVNYGAMEVNAVAREAALKELRSEAK
jgi:hypothetical protein